MKIIQNQHFKQYTLIFLLVSATISGGCYSLFYSPRNLNHTKTKVKTKSGIYHYPKIEEISTELVNFKSDHVFASSEIKISLKGFFKNPNWIMEKGKSRYIKKFKIFHYGIEQNKNVIIDLIPQIANKRIRKLKSNKDNIYNIKNDTTYFELTLFHVIPIESKSTDNFIVRILNKSDTLAILQTNER